MRHVIDRVTVDVQGSRSEIKYSDIPQSVLNAVDRLDGVVGRLAVRPDRYRLWVTGTRARQLSFKDEAIDMLEELHTDDVMTEAVFRIPRK